MIRIVIADDQALVRGGFRSILSTQADIDVTGEAADGARAVELCRQTKPDVILMDIRMPVLDGIAATRAVVQSGYARVLILTTFDIDEYVYAALKAGASGFILKDGPAEGLPEAVRIVAAGQALLAPSVTRKVVEEYVRAPAPGSPLPEAILALTERESAVLKAMAMGMSNAEIGHHLFLAGATIKTHVTHVLAKLGLRDRLQAVVYACESGLVRPGGQLTRLPALAAPAEPWHEADRPCSGTGIRSRPVTSEPAMLTRMPTGRASPLRDCDIHLAGFPAAPPSPATLCLSG